MSEIKVNSVVNSTGDNDSGLDLSTNDQVKVKVANATDFIFKANSLEVQTGSNIDMNGTELILDADGDTSIEASSDDIMVFDTGGSERMRIESGHLLIGTTNDGISSSSSSAGINLKATGAVEITRNDSPPVFINRNTSSGTVMQFRKDGTQEGAISVDGDILKIFATKSTANCGLGFFSNNTIRPVGNNGSEADNEVDLGHSSTRIDDVRATNGTIQTSDENEKQDIASATAKELNVAKKLSALFKTFRWKDKVIEKGDKARTHTGIVAQEVQTAFKAEGLDASNYGLFTSDTWWEKEIKVDAVKADEEKGIEAKDAYTYIDTKDEKTDGYTERTRLGVRYPELFSFIFSSIEARLTALESK